MCSVFISVFIKVFSSQAFSPAATREVSASALLTYMMSNNYLNSLEGGQVASFPRHNITCPVNSVAPVRINVEEVGRMRMNSRSALSLVAGKRPSAALVSTVTKALSNIVIMSDVQVRSRLSTLLTANLILTLVFRGRFSVCRGSNITRKADSRSLFTTSCLWRN